jgi:hypothetical protein
MRPIRRNPRDPLSRASLTQCPFCDRLSFEWEGHSAECCAGEVRVLRAPRAPSPLLIEHILGEARRARFEFGETGEPLLYARPAGTRCDVYMAGPVLEDIDGEEVVLPWRAEIFGYRKHRAFAAGRDRVGQFHYAGPTIEASHGRGNHGLARRCLEEVRRAELVFCWIDRKDTAGTLVEIGAAYAAGKPVFIAFAKEYLAEHFYFIGQLATVAVVTPDVVAAWKLFERWRPTD